MKNESWNGEVLGALLTDLSKVFDGLPHNSQIAKLNEYRFSTALKAQFQDQLSSMFPILLVLQLFLLTYISC